MRSVLHLDRSKFFQRIISRIFGERSIPVHFADSIKEALSLLESSADIDLVFSANELVDGTASDLLTAMEKKLPTVPPVIVVSASENLDSRESLFRRGVLDYITKEDLTFERFDRYVKAFLQDDLYFRRLQGLSVAILDDSLTERTMLKHILELKGIRDIDLFASAEDLFVATKEYQVYLVDIVLPKQSGEEVILSLRVKQPHAIILAISGISNPKTIANALMSGADDFLVKPVEPVLLVSRLKAVSRTNYLLEELEAKRKLLEELSITDSLTRIINRGELLKRLEEANSHARATNSQFCVLLLDVDNFKSINDTWGHPVGDSVLVEMVEAIHGVLRQGSQIGRYGGEEFMVIFSSTPISEARSACERILRQVRARTYSEKNLAVTVSGGLAASDGDDAATCIKNADELLYLAKQQGKDRILMRNRHSLEVINPE